jgi:hypothetical protein
VAIHVDLVQSGPDWPIILTATVGVAGIVGTAWQARRARIAAAEEARLAREAAGTAAQTSLNAVAENLQQTLDASAADLRTSLAAATDNLLTGIGAEDRRAERNFKARVYATCQTAFLVMLMAVVRHRRACIEAKTPQDVMATMHIVDEPRQAMVTAVSEVRLLAPVDVANLATELQAAFLRFIEESRQGAPFPGGEVPHAAMQEQLYEQMRQDLGVAAS